MRIESVRAENFLSYRNLEIDFDEYKDSFVLVEGSVTDKLKTDSNGAGKSTIVEAIVYGFFGKTVRNMKYADDVINSQVGKNCSVEIVFGDYVVERYRKHSKHKNCVYLYQMVDGKLVDLRGKSDTETQERINHAIGMDYNCFIGSHIFTGSSAKFTSISDSERKNLLRSLCDAGWINDSLERVKERQKQVEDKVHDMQLKESSLHGALNSIVESRVVLLEKFRLAKKNETDFKTVYADGLKKYQEEINLLELDTKEREADIKYYTESISEYLETLSKHKLDIEKQKGIDEKICGQVSSKNKLVDELSNCEGLLVESDSVEKSLLYELGDKKKTLEIEKGKQGNYKDNNDFGVKEFLQEKKMLVSKLSQGVFNGLQQQMADVNSEVKSLDVRIAGLKLKNKKWRDGVDMFCDKCQQDISRQHIEKMVLQGQEEISKLELEKEKVRSALSGIHANIKKRDGIQEDILKVDSSISAAEKRKNDYMLESEKLKSVIDLLGAELKGIKFKLDCEKNNRKALKEKVGSIKKDIDSINLMLLSLKKEKDLKGDFKEVIIKCNKLELEIKHLEKIEMPGAQAKINKNNNDVMLCNSEVTKLNAKKGSLESLIVLLFDDMALSQKKVSEVEAKIDDIKKGLLEVETVREKLKLASKIFGKEGLQNHIFNMIIPEFKNKVNYYVSKLSDDLAVDISTQLEQKKNTVNKINFNPYVIRGGGNGYSSISSGQKRKVDIACSMAIKSLYGVFGKGLGFSFYDEILDNLDSTGVNQVVDMLKLDTGTRFLVTHNNEIKSEFDKTIVVSMSKNISQLR